MKIIKLKSEQECKLWEYFEQNLPSSLIAKKYTDGYGYIFGVHVKEGSNFLDRVNPFSDGIATITNSSVELRHPEYFSDFEDIINGYERLTGKEVEFRFWES